MKVFEEILLFLRKPFPIWENSWVYYRIVLMLSLFVTFFLYIFQPFGISTLESDKFLICLGFGGSTFLGAAVYELLVHQILKLRTKLQKWTYGKWMIDNLGIMLLISLANFLFIRFLLFGFLDWSLFPQMLYATLMIGIIPLAIIGGFALLKTEKKYQLIAQEINSAQGTTSADEKAHSTLIFEVPIQRIRFIEALQNYAKIGYINTDGNLKVRVERITLKRILEETKGTSIIKCHRSYLVNKDAIITTAGNAQGLLLSLSDCDKIIPVSRSLVPLFRES